MMKKNEELLDKISAILEENPNYSAQQVFKKLHKQYCLKDIIGAMIELECEIQHLTDPAKIEEIKRVLVGDMKCA